MTTYLGIDVGTSSVKVVLIGAGERLIASASVALEVSRPHPGWSEQDPDSWVQAAFQAIDRLKADHPTDVAAVRGIGLSGQQHGATLLDAADKPLRPAILWNDGRSFLECRELEAACPRARAITGNVAMAGFTAPKLLWVRKHEPAIFEKVAKVLLPKDYVRLCLTGDHASDMSDSAGTYWLDVANRCWSDELLAVTHLTVDHMPKLYEGTEPTGRLRPELAERWGMTERPVLAGGGGDNAASAVGMGAVKPGVAFASLGTSGVLFVSNASFMPNTAGAIHAFCHAVPGTWHQMGVILSATASLEWLSGILEAPAPSLTKVLDPQPDRPSPVIFLPYLAGERTPHNDANIRGGFFGIGLETDRRMLTQAVLEGVAYAFRDSLRVLGDAGTHVERAFAVGGGTKSEAWLRILASVLNRPLDITAEGDFGGAFGAARMGRIAATGDDPFETLTPPPIARTVEPDPTLVAAYDESYARYRALYPAVQEAKNNGE